MTARPPKHPRMRALLFASVGVVAIAIACSKPAPDMVAPRGVNPTAVPAQAPGTFYDFQVEKAAAAYPSNMPPRYPDELRAAGIEGKVIGKFVVDTAGRADMRTFEVIEANHPEFAAAVREALPEMRFYPATVAGRPVKQLIQMPFTFGLVGKAKSSPEARTGQPLSPRKPNVLYETPADDSMPSFLASNTPPIFPNQLRAANIEGMVQAMFIVREDGRVDLSTFKATRSDHALFEAAVRDAAAKWRFRPAMKDGKPVSKLVNMPFMFSLAR